MIWQNCPPDLQSTKYPRFSCTLAQYDGLGATKAEKVCRLETGGVIPPPVSSARHSAKHPMHVNGHNSAPKGLNKGFSRWGSVCALLRRCGPMLRKRIVFGLVFVRSTLAIVPSKVLRLRCFPCRCCGSLPLSELILPLHHHTHRRERRCGFPFWPSESVLRFAPRALLAGINLSTAGQGNATLLSHEGNAQIAGLDPQNRQNPHRWAVG